MVSLGDNGWDKSYLPIVQRFVENLVLHCIRVVASFPIVEHHFDVLEIQTECDKFSLRYQQRLGCLLCGNVCVLKNKVLGNWFGVDKFQKHQLSPEACSSYRLFPSIRQVLATALMTLISLNEYFISFTCMP
jgi:hypothetical protein